MPRHGISGFAMAAAMLGGAAPALAQTVADSAGKTTAGNEDIIVTAQRRDESLSRTPVAVDPDATLRAHASEMGWQIISLR